MWRPAFNSFRYFCEYIHNDKIKGPTKIKYRQGSIFEDVDSCQRCRCSERGMDCCDTGLKVKIEPALIPVECHTIKDGCDQYLVYKGDNTTDCATGRPAKMVRQEQIAEDKRSQYIEDILYKEVMKEMGATTGANNEGEGNLKQWVLLDYFLNDAFVGRIPSPIVEQQKARELFGSSPIKANIADSNLGALTKGFVDSLGGPDAARATLMERIKKYGNGGPTNQEPNDNLPLLYILSMLLN
ncbi:uncharacterized protein LOC133196834 [Saccostrea echinata]|uniref:uncharacterized protein LOC133196834 n=1 Tax=Saccostrea echinata TaxID=191078 RepID=UPI002A83011E|nr:uncharacterized protein LOC133196834 [Saccostrea echinata]